MGFAQWLRSNSEHYLAIDAQQRVGARYGARMPEKARGWRERFWRHVFTPAYRLLPWGLRRSIIGALPGSHRRAWPVRSDRPRGPAI